MGLALQENFYYSAFKAKTRQSEEQIYVRANKHLEFTQTAISYKEYAKHYTTTQKSINGRKVAALPATFLCVVGKTTCHLGVMVLIGLPSGLIGDTKPFKSQLFCVIRDFQEGFGRFISIFHDRLGMYHIQQSQFHKLFYNVSLIEKSYGALVRDAFKDKYPVGYTSSSQESKHTKEKFDKLGVEKLVRLFPFFSRIHWDLIDDKYLNLFDFEKMNSSDITNIFYNGFRRADEKKLSKLHLENYLSLLRCGPSQFYDDIPKSHLNSLPFSQLTDQQLRNIFPTRLFSSTQKLLEMLSPSNFQIFSSRCDITQYYEWIPSKYINSLNYRNLTKKQLTDLFDLNNHSSKKSSKERLEALSKANFKLIVPLFALQDFDVYGKYVLQHMEIENLTVEQLNAIFRTNGKSRFSTLTSAKALAILQRGCRVDTSWVTYAQLCNNKIREIVEELNKSQPKQPKDHFRGNQKPQRDENIYKPEIDYTPHYNALNLTSAATEKEVTTAYRTLARKYHPDRNPKLKDETDESFKQRLKHNQKAFQVINEANSILMDYFALLKKK